MQARYPEVAILQVQFSHMQFTSTLFLCAALTSFAAWGQVDQSNSPYADSAPELKIDTPINLKLDNGLQIIVVENHRTPSVTWNMTLEFLLFGG